MKDKETIVNFLKNMAQQDNRCTASPYYYVIRTKTRRVAFNGCGDYVRYFDPEDPERDYGSLDEYIADQKECLEYDDMLEEEKEEFNEKMKDAEYDLEKVEYVDDWEEKGMFLTETDAKNHLASNHYHYSSDAQTYVKHAWRAPELKEFFQALYSHFEIEKGNLDL